jgi:geranylgeranylglycerol-phosphate geranylgeranyltransferase
MNVRAISERIRINLVTGAGLFAVLGFLTVFFVSGSANISNDYFNWHVDADNLPSTSP